MKYLKLFDSHTMGKYWYIKIPENFNEFGAYLYAIGVDDISNAKMSKTVLYQLNNNKYPRTEFFIYYRNNMWSFYYDQNCDNEYYTYQGEVLITDKDIEKWEINQSINKYNL